MYVLIAVFDNEDDAGIAQSRTTNLAEWSNLQVDVPDGAVVIIKNGDNILFEQEVVEEEADEDDDDDYETDM